MCPKKVFCINCDCLVETDLHYDMVTLNKQNIKFTATECSVTCKICGEPLYDSFMHDVNANLRSLAYYNAVFEAMNKDNGGTCSR